MSQSPIDDLGDEATLRYKQGWAALSRLLHMDRSFSGNERNTAFLSLGGEGFVDFSAVSGFDHADDSRTVVTSDWDFDGDLDVWVSSRTAPRLRLLRNDLKRGGESVFLRLHGDGEGTNRDAVGARCELSVRGDDRPISRVVMAGDSFLSQNTNWLHFGLGNDAEIVEATVFWPGGDAQKFTGVEPGRRYDLHQGRADAEEWKPPAARRPLSPSKIAIEPEPDAARIVLPSKLPLPPLSIFEDGETEELKLKGVTLINVWASWCAPCIAELREWTAHAEDFRKAGLDVIALNTDQLEVGRDAASAQQALQKIGFPFRSANTDAESVLGLDLFQRSFLDRWLPLPVPSSFLVDRDGDVAVIYKGAVPAKRVLQDMALLDASREELMAASTPFEGSWASRGALADPARFVSQLIDHRELDIAERYLGRFVETERGRTDSSPSVVVGALKSLAFLTSNRGDHAAAIVALEEALSLQEGNVELQRSLAEARQKESAKRGAGRLDELRAAVEANPKDAAAHLKLADALRGSGEFAEAIEGYKNALRNDPKLLVAAGRLSWTLAVHPDPEFRRPAEALALAKRLNLVSKGSDPSTLDLLGIAQAATGDFEGAAASARAALALFEVGTPIQKEAKERLGLYEKGTPYIKVEWGSNR